ncbi:toxin-activating lysine-acyltransferase [Chitiniphilus shinanonensis]|uniref:toxin-activating lysine-acyltransferase n=1 Tax=Chitiniphilus shinanonensis TaxID=553088 RepID=UPI0012FBFE9B|nr:toxin-activating lysine-acyltransferase [Chitiniphilus shinanonensis]
MSEKLGYASYLSGIVPSGEKKGLSLQVNIWTAAIYHEQIHFFFDEKGSPVAYVMWAFPSPDVQLMLAANPSYVLHESEWDEAGPPWIVDLVVMPGYLRSVLRNISSKILKDADIVRFVHSKPNRRRVITWRVQG